MRFAYLLMVGIVLVSGCIGQSNETSTISAPFAPTTSISGPAVELTVISAPGCGICDTSQIIAYTRNKVFPNVQVREIDGSSKEAGELIGELGITVLPAYIFDKSVERQENFKAVNESLVEKGGSYVINPASLGGGKFLNPPGADDDPVKGSENATVTIVEFSDFECPFCAKFYRETLPLLEKDYIHTGKVKLVYRDFPLTIHDYAPKAAEAAQCANEQGRFWAYHDRLYDSPSELNISDLKRHAVELGFDSKKFDECLDSGKYAEEVMADVNDGNELGMVSATPTFFVNGIAIIGAQPYEVFEQVIDSQLSV
ncbi:MAG: DsbA family protein [Candidatus Altiarchaeota archaeon]